jgi:hypothetical protein
MISRRHNRHSRLQVTTTVATGFFSLALGFPTVSAQTPFPADQASASAGETSELRFYGVSTQIGIVACRTIRDRTGKIAREVYYSAATGLVPQIERDLRVQSISVYFYDAKGRVDHIEHWEVGRRALRVEHNAYDTSGALSRKWFVEPDGVRRYEMRFSDSRKLADLYFDDTGLYLTSLRGQLVSDVDLLHGWGTTSNGMACGITLSTEHGRFDKIGVWVNIKNVATESVMIVNLEEPSFELHDANGTAIPLSQAASGIARGVEKSRPYLNGQLLDHAEAGFMYPAYNLADYFDALSPGKYTLRVRQPVPERNVTLVSNDVTFVVL